MAFNCFVLVLLMVFWCVDGSQPRGVLRTTPINPQHFWNETNVDKLRKNILINYDKYARPANSYEKSELRVGLALVHLETDEVKLTFSVHALLKMVWTDPKLQWNVDDYNISLLHMAHHEIWQPDMYLYNSASTSDSVPIRFGYPNVIVHPNGQVVWVPPVKMTAFCAFEMKHWPYDQQNCSLKLTSWTYNGDELELKLFNNTHEVDMSERVMDDYKWDIETQVAIKKKHELFFYAEFAFYLTRRTSIFENLIVSPAFAVMFLTLLQFWISPRSEAKIYVNLGAILIIVLYLLFFALKMSIVRNIPLIVQFYTISLFLSCVATLEAIVVLGLCKSHRQQSLPWIIKKHLPTRFAKLLGVSTKEDKRRSQDTNGDDDETKAHQLTVLNEPSSNVDADSIIKSNYYYNQSDWLVFALIIDRLSFVTYSIIYSIIAIIYVL